ncbi:MAG TPA: dihydrolipoamide acetyltransferase family protein [Candidatus Binataceae bacterium]|nr:dihydrolipoamide acetyltransferase family protein [Candidatus Binataceae bacterium]
MSLEVTMPQMGESVVEGTVTRWLVKVGDRVTEDQPLCEISTDKVDTEIPSPASGVIAELLAAEGQTLPIGSKIAVIETAAAATADVRAAAPAPAPPPRRTTATPPQTAAAEPPPAVDAGPAAPVAAPVRPSMGAAARATNGAPRRYSPVVLRMAEEHGIDLSAVPGTGIGGRVSKRDVERYLETLRAGGQAGRAGQTAPASAVNGAAGAAASAAPPVASVPPATGAIFRPPVYQPREGDTVEPFTRRRKLIAEHMVFSKTHAPHVGTVAEVDLTRLSALRDRHKAAFQAREGFALTLLPFAVMATVRALKEFPRMNAAVAGDAMIIRREINLGVAMDAAEGLVVPVIKGADTFTVTGLAREIERLRRKVQDGSLSADDLAGGSFTLSNPGREGNLYGFAIINQPQVGILRMGEVKRRPVVIEVDGAEALAIRTMMYLALSYDHRVIDGVLGNRFLYRTARLLEEADFEL